MSSSFARHRIGFSRLLVALVMATVILTDSYWHHQAPLLAQGLTALGLVLATVGGVGRLWCNLYIVGYKNAQLLTIGPYSMTRHPLYFFSAIGGIGVGLTSGTLSIAATIAALFAATYPSVVRSEEARQLKLHGDAWTAYARRVPQFLPNPSLLDEPGDYLAHPRLFRRHLLDAVWFPWAAAVLMSVGPLRDAGLLPALFTLY